VSYLIRASTLGGVAESLCWYHDGETVATMATHVEAVTWNPTAAWTSFSFTVASFLGEYPIWDWSEAVMSFKMRGVGPCSWSTAAGIILGSCCSKAALEINANINSMSHANSMSVVLYKEFSGSWYLGDSSVATHMHSLKVMQLYYPKTTVLFLQWYVFGSDPWWYIIIHSLNVGNNV